MIAVKGDVIALSTEGEAKRRVVTGIFRERMFSLEMEKRIIEGQIMSLKEQMEEYEGNCLHR